jgi:transcriptional regulator with XRE-family HTH domain
MTTKQERLKEVYDHLRSYFGIHTQIDFAEAIRITRPALSSAMNGNEAYLTKNLFQKICATYPGVFNLDYLLTGEGTLITEQGRLHNMDIKNTISPTPEPQAIDYTLLTEKAVEKATAYADKTIAILEKQVSMLEKDVEAKNEEIKRLKTMLHEYEIATTVIAPNQNYPFEVGVSEKTDMPSAEI